MGHRGLVCEAPLRQPRPARVAPTRLDVWLDVSCLFKTRSLAQQACRAGKVDVNGETARPHRSLKEGDDIVITRRPGHRQTVRVLGFAEHHVAKAEARALYLDRTPPPTPEEVEAAEMERLFRRSNPRPVSAPDRRTQRAVRRLKRME